MVRYSGRHAAAKPAAEAGQGREAGAGAGGEAAGGGRKFRRGVTTTAVAAVALAALTASQAPGAELVNRVGDEGGDRAGAPLHDQSPGDDSYHTELPPLESPAPPSTSPGGSGDGSGLGSVGSDSGIPATLLAAYKKAAGSLSGSAPGCGLRWELLAGIGKVESGQARGGAVDKEGATLKPILGPVLNGSGFARIKDTDGGVWDGDRRYDRAVGPLQFIPSTWSRWGVDGNGDGQRDPNNVYDAALAAGRYLCSSGRELTLKADLDRAILGYNDSQAYLRTVLAWFDYYRKGTHRVPDGSGPLPTSSGAGVGSGSGAGSGAGKHSGPHGSGSGSGSGKHTRSPSHSPSQEPSPGSGSHKPGGGSSGSPSPSPTQTAPASVQPVGEGQLTATAGEDFTDRAEAKVTDKDGKPVKGVQVRFAIKGTTDARFSGDALSATVTTGADGIATAPAISAGDTPGTFSVDATAVGRDLPAAHFGALVKEKPAPQADALARTSDETPTAEPDASFAADAVKIKASYQGGPAADVPLNATLIVSRDLPLPNLTGPYFKDDAQNPVHVLTGLKTDKNGQLTLPRLFTDGHEGTFTLRLTSPTGAKLDVPLKVAEK